MLNIYNDSVYDVTIEKVKSFQRKINDNEQVQQNEDTYTIWLENFNRHHPHWDNISNIRLFTKEAINKTEKLINAVADAGLDFALPLKIPTHKHNVFKKWSRLDYVFLSEHLLDTLISCEVISNDLMLNTNHLPIVTNLDFSIAKAPMKRIVNYRNIN